MRHGNKINHLGRKTAHRKALLMNLSIALITHKRITTTLAKAKVLREHIEPLLNKTKLDTTHNRRILFSYLQDKESIKELFGVIADKIATRPGGYTRIIKMGFRKGDAAEMAMIELVDFNEVYTNKPGEATGKKKSRRGKGAAKSASPESETALINAADDETLIEDVEAQDVATEETPDTENAVKEVSEDIEDAEIADTLESSEQTDNSEDIKTSDEEDPEAEQKK